MKLTLSVSSGSGNEIDSITINQVSATIGRNGDNTLVLEDPKRYVSGRHAVIDYRSSGYFITDTSANGLLINDLTQLVGSGSSTQLNDGDHLHIGDYTISVSIVNEQQSGQTSSGALPYQALDFSDDPFAELKKDSVQEMIDENQLMPPDCADKRLPPGFTNTDDFDFVDPGLKEKDKDIRPVLEQPPAVQGAFQPFKPENNIKQKSPTVDGSIPDDWFTESPAKNNTSSKDKSPEKIVSGQKTLADPLKYRTPSFVKSDAPLEGKKPANVSDIQTLIVENFLRGAGLENDGINEELTPETFYIIGKILRTSIQGTIDVLIGRSKIKNEMHMDVTMIRSGKNNPVKFSVSAKEAIRKLLAPQDAGYLKADEAIEEAFDDIRAHQIAVIAGMQTGLLEVLMRFDPQKLEQRLQKKNPISASIPIHRQAKLWGLFEHQYEDIEREASDNFYQLFGQVFAESYEEQIIKLKNSKKHKPL
jgi:type VI secretion system protein